jgi:hypothetical protein
MSIERRTMQLPTIHLNGTSKERLIEALCEASQALDLAFSALKQTAPNGRDYYPQGPEAIHKATEEHLARLRRLDDIKNEIDALALAIDELENDA